MFWGEQPPGGPQMVGVPAVIFNDFLIRLHAGIAEWGRVADSRVARFNFELLSGFPLAVEDRDQ
jgi:hypothetical protein